MSGLQGALHDMMWQDWEWELVLDCSLASSRALGSELMLMLSRSDVVCLRQDEITRHQHHDQGWTMTQRRRTLYPQWQGSLDAHVVKGRVMTVVLMKSLEEPVAEGTVNIMALAKHCVNSSNGSSKYFVDLLPSGMVLLHLEIFREPEDTTV